MLSYSRSNSFHLPSLCYNFTHKSVSLHNLLFELQALQRPPLVSDNGVIGCMYHCCVIDSWKIVIDEVKFIQTKQGRPNRLNLDISKVFSDTAMTASAKGNVRELLPRCWVILKVAVRLEVQRVFPRVPQAVVDSGRYTDLVAGGNTVASNSLGSFGHPHHGHYRRSEP